MKQMLNDIAVKLSDASRSLTGEKRLWQGRLQESLVDFSVSSAVIYWGEELKQSSGRKDLLFAWIWIHKEGFRGAQMTKTVRILCQSWKFECTRTLNYVNMHMCLCEFSCLAVSVVSQKTFPQHFLKEDWHIYSMPQNNSACQSIQINLAFASIIPHHAKSA